MDDWIQSPFRPKQKPLVLFQSTHGSKYSEPSYTSQAVGIYSFVGQFQIFAVNKCHSSILQNAGGLASLYIECPYLNSLHWTIAFACDQNDMLPTLHALNYSL